VKQMEIHGSTAPDFTGDASAKLSAVELARGPGGPIGTKTAFAQTLPMPSRTVRYVKFYDPVGIRTA